MIRSLRLYTASLLLILGAAYVPVRAQSADPGALPLPEAYFPELKGILEAAVKQSPRMLIRNLEELIAEQGRISARAGQLPTVGGSLQYNPWQRDDRADLEGPTRTKKLYYNLSLNQPLYHWGALESNTRIGKLQQKIAQGQTAEAYRMLAQEIRNLYLQLILKKLTVARAQLQIQIATDQLAIAQTKFEKKVISEGEMFMPRINHDQSILSADRVNEDFEQSKRAFAKLTGGAPLADSQIADSIPAVTPAPEALNSLLNAHLANRDLNSYYLDTLRRQLDVEKLNHQVASARLKPKLNFVAGVSQDEQSYTSNIAQKYKLQSTFVGVQVYWSIFDGYATRSAKAISVSRQREIEQNFAEASANLLEQSRSQLRQLEFASRSMDLSNRLLGSSEGNLHGKQDDLRRGLASESEVNLARIGYYDAQVSAYNNRADYLMKSADFLSTILEDPALANLPKH